MIGLIKGLFVKPSTAWILLVIAMCAGAYWFATSGQLHYPPPEVAKLELARGDIASSSSCLSVDDVLHANNLANGPTSPKATWTSRVKDEWTLRLDLGKHSWRTYRFIVEGGRLVPMQVVSSDDLPDISTEQAIDEWIAKIHSPPAESCRLSGD
jgi:hypothetical protein